MELDVVSIKLAVGRYQLGRSLRYVCGRLTGPDLPQGGCVHPCRYGRRRARRNKPSRVIPIGDAPALAVLDVKLGVHVRHHDGVAALVAVAVHPALVAVSYTHLTLPTILLV
eukprot:606009-Pyramimonas_sp.AAC.1